MVLLILFSKINKAIKNNTDNSNITIIKLIFLLYMPKVLAVTMKYVRKAIIIEEILSTKYVFIIVIISNKKINIAKNAKTLIIFSRSQFIFIKNL